MEHRSCAMILGVHHTWDQHSAPGTGLVMTQSVESDRTQVSVLERVCVPHRVAATFNCPPECHDGGRWSLTALIDASFDE